MTGPPRSIVVPITLAADSAQLLEVAAPLAGALGAELTLVGIAPVVPAAPAVAQAGESVGLAPHAEQRLLDLLVQERLDDLSGRLPAAARARTVLTWGPPGPALIAVAREQQAELIVVPMRRDSVLGHALHDHADRHVLHHSDVPVLVVPTRRPLARRPPSSIRPVE